MNHEQRVIGYGYRIRLDTSDTRWGSWDAKRRQTFLLEINIVLPLSADSSVWPSALNDAAWEMLPDADLDALAWLQLETLEEAAKLCGDAAGVRLAFTEVCPEEHWCSGLPDRLPADAVFLGYDIVDEGSISVLMNHGRVLDSADALEAWRARWIPHLNAHHLFGEEETAEAFLVDAKADDLARSDAGGYGHGQFCVVGVWALDSLRPNSP